ncbi:MAG: glutamate synthase domain-containing protein 2/nitrite reductase [Kiritimatiellia bacterium]|jgi:glutamate synthase domain-containing protein 2/nitrite reductase/ring-hydroxylating ferredoxin subunit
MSKATFVRPQKIATFSDLTDRQPAHALVEGVDLVMIRWDDKISVMYGRCHHRGALLADGLVEGQNLICGVHGWDYRFDTGVSEYNNDEALHRFNADIDDDGVWIDAQQVAFWAVLNPQPYQRDEYLGAYQDPHGSTEEPYNAYIQRLAREGLSKLGHHGVVAAMGVPLTELPRWSDVQLLTGQLARMPLLDDAPVDTTTVIGPRAKKPLTLAIPIFVSDMSFGALSEEAKVALAIGAELAGTGICSGEGGMLSDEQKANSSYFYELASARFGWHIDNVKKVQAFHFKGGQGAKTGTGGHLPGNKVSERIAAVRGLQPGQAAISPSRFADLTSPAHYRAIAEQVREASGGIPIGFKLSAQHIEDDLDFALDVGVDYVILDGRGGATGAAPTIFRDNISVPTMVALARARRHLDARGAHDVSLIITGGLRTESDFVKALAMGADAIAIANSALQAIGCLGMRACHTNNCPVGIATQKVHLRERLVVQASARRLANYLEATTELMQVLARAAGHSTFTEFSMRDLCTWKRDIAYLTGVKYGGVMPL